MTKSVIDAFKSLNVKSAQDYTDHEAIFQVSYQYLSEVKDFKDIEAFHNCIVALISADKYYKALEFMKKVPVEVHSQFPLEKAYVYYKTGHYAEVQELYQTTLGSSDISDVVARAMKHVMAQCHYQRGSAADALKLYKELILENAIDNEVDMACNERALLSQLASQSSSAQQPTHKVGDADLTYDICLNEALIELAKNNMSLSLQLLKSASKMCLEQNVDADATDLALEHTPIQLAMAYVYQAQGDTSKAKEVLDSVDTATVTDLLTMLILKNNRMALEDRPENLNYVSRELNYQRNLHLLRHKMTSAQYQALVRNHLLLSYQTKTISKTSLYFEASSPGNSSGNATNLIFKVLVALGITQEDLHSADTKHITRKLLKYGLKRLEKGIDDTLIAAVLLLVHLNRATGKFDQSILLLAKIADRELSLPAQEMHGAVFGSLFFIYEKTAAAKYERDLFEALLEKFALVSLELLLQDDDLYDFMRTVVFKSMALGVGTDVSQHLSILANSRQDALVKSAQTGDRSGLMPASELASSADVDTLLTVDVESLVVNRPGVSRSIKTNKSYKVSKPLKPKFSASKVLKAAADFSAEDLDPERWLPMKLRSYYKPSKKELKKRGHQGAVEGSPAPQTKSASKNNSKKKKKGKK